MNILIDQGNSFCKIALYNNQKFEIHIVDDLSVEFLKDLFLKYDIKKGIITTVKSIDSTVLIFLKKHLQLFIELSHDSNIPIKLKYETPETLGKDRIAAAVGAHTIFPDKNVLIIDMGTAITCDFIENNTFLGGNISPGLKTRFKSLDKETNQLPLLNKKGETPFIGNSTSNAIISGVQSGIVFEVEGYIRYMNEKYNDFKIILTGGDSSFFEKLIKKTIFAESNLIFIGLNKIIEYND